MLRILGGELHTEAVALGLAIDPASAAGWRDSRVWCIFCGQHRMQGLFDPMPDGRINLRLHCPECKEIEVNSLGLADLTNARSFIPALKKIINEAGRYFSEAMEHGGECVCWICGNPTKLHLIYDEHFQDRYGLKTWLESTCTCIHTFTSAISLYGIQPQVNQFVLGNDRIVLEPESETSYEGQCALHFRLFNRVTGRRVCIFASKETLLPLSIIVE
jgi:hypothetical protein